MHLSIVIPAFNEEQLILDCLNSIQESVNANQKPGFTYEVIVVDNKKKQAFRVLLYSPPGLK